MIPVIGQDICKFPPGKETMKCAFSFEERFTEPGSKLACNEVLTTLAHSANFIMLTFAFVSSKHVTHSVLVERRRRYFLSKIAVSSIQ